MTISMMNTAWLSYDPRRYHIPVDELKSFSFWGREFSTLNDILIQDKESISPKSTREADLW